MTRELYRYTFKAHVPIEEIEASLVLAIFATESLHGEAQVRLDAGHYLDPDRRACVVEAGAAAGKDLREFLRASCAASSQTPSPWSA